MALLTLASTVPSAAQSLVAVGPLLQPASGHSATRLLDGKVLLVGTDRHAELFDPAVNNWSRSGYMSVATAGFTTTLLSDGRVLVVGGRQPTAYYEIVDRAELYDPAVGIWSTAASIPSARLQHAAVLAADGLVWVLGGLTYTGVIRGPNYDPSAESPLALVTRFDPVTQTWATGVNLPDARFRHTATRVANGDIIVLGGSNATGATNTCWRFPATGSAWTNCASMSATRSGHSATLLSDGRIFVAGGATTTAGFEQIYDPTLNQWTATSVVSRTTVNHVAFERSGNSLIVWGGADSSGFSPTGTIPPLSATSQRYYFVDPQPSSSGASRFAVRAGHTATQLLDGRVLVAGGFTGYYGIAIGGGVVYQASSTNDSFVVDRTPARVAANPQSYERLPASPVAGDRYPVVGTSLYDSTETIKGIVTITDGEVSCQRTALSNCRLTAATSGPKQYTISYPGDLDFYPATLTYQRPPGELFRIEIAGSGSGGVTGRIAVGSGQTPNCAPFSPFYLQNCDVTVAVGSSVTLTAQISSAADVFVGWQGACAGTSNACTIITTSAQTVVRAVFAKLAEGPFTLDLDKDGVIKAPSDGQLLRRFLARLHDGNLTQGVLGNAPTRSDPDAIEDRLTDLQPLLDLDRDGVVDMNTDGLMIVRYMLGFRGAALTKNALSAKAGRTDPVAIAADLAILIPN